MPCFSVETFLYWNENFFVTVHSALEKNTACGPGTFWDVLAGVCGTLICDGAAPEDAALNNSCVDLRGVKQLFQSRQAKFALLFHDDIGTSKNIAEPIDDLTLAGIALQLKMSGILVSDSVSCDMQAVFEVQGNCSMFFVEKYSKSTVFVNKTVSSVAKIMSLYPGIRVALAHTLAAAEKQECVTGQKVKRSASLVKIGEDEEFITDQANLKVSAVDVPWYVDLSDDADSAKTFQIFICEPELITCDKVVIGPESFSKVSDERLRLQENEEQIEEHEFVWSRSNVVICAEKLGRTSEKPSTKYTTATRALSGLAVWVSFLGAAATLVTYALFPSLRNIPGKIVMNLCVALMVGELLLFAAYRASSYKVMCKIVGVNLSFWWLACFCWFNVLAFDFFKTFSNLSNIPVHENEFVRILKYAAYGWGAPFIFVSVCLALDLSDIGEYHFGASEGGSCWLTTDIHQFLSFGIPLLIMLMVNAFFFVRCVAGLCAAIRVANKAKNSSSSKAKTSSLLLYVRICSVMGFTWVFAVAFGFIQTAVLLYLHIICNGLQGVFIFTCFCANRRVWHMYKQKFCGQSAAKASSTDSSVSKKTSSDLSVQTVTVSVNSKLQDPHGSLGDDVKNRV